VSDLEFLDIYPFLESKSGSIVDVKLVVSGLQDCHDLFVKFADRLNKYLVVSNRDKLEFFNDHSIIPFYMKLNIFVKAEQK